MNDKLNLLLQEHNITLIGVTEVKNQDKPNEMLWLFQCIDLDNNKPILHNYYKRTTQTEDEYNQSMVNMILRLREK